MAICTLHYIKTHNEKQVMTQIFGKKKCLKLRFTYDISSVMSIHHKKNMSNKNL